MPFRCALLRCILLLAPFLALTARAQSMPGMPDMPGMTMPMNSHNSPDSRESTDPMPPPQTLIGLELQHSSSGTSIEPASTPHPMLMLGEHRGWSLMLHGSGFLADTQQHASGDSTQDRRGGGKLFSTNWIMPMAMRRLGRGELTLRAMFSLEPATVTGRFYPELFQQGETAYGRPIVDGQHPHDFVMELAAVYDLRLGEHALLSFYAGPVGDPAIGPTAYPHRLSASEDPIAALGHHQQDSTHIAFNVVTAGLTYKAVRVEASGFHGAEPDEQRWHLQPSPNGLAIDSYSGRVTVSPTPNLSGQYSIAHITSPESLSPAENQRRQTASVMYNRPLGGLGGNWSSTLLWGQAKALPANGSSAGDTDNSYLLESLLQLRTRNFAWTRVESAARTSELLLDSGSGTLPPEVPVGHVQAYTLGYGREITSGRVRVAPGAQLTVYRAPDGLVSTYGRTPFGAVVFLRVRLAQ
jgi:hypothetical protein